jgi:Zn-dependent M32 family carboxypeptidase
MQIIIRDNVLDGLKETEKSDYSLLLAQYAAEKPLRDWEQAMAETDAKLPRYAEDIIDALDKPTRDKLAKKTLDAYAEKKAKRAEKP